MPSRTTITAVLSINGLEGEILEGLSAVSLEHRWAAHILEPSYASEEALLETKPALCFFGPCDTVPKLLQCVDTMRVSIGVDRTNQGIHSVMPDDEAIGREAARHLLERGFRNFSAFAHAGNAFAQRRIAGFRQAVQAGGGEYFGDGEHFGTRPPAITTPSSENIGLWLNRLPKPVGIFAVADRWASLVGRITWNMSISVPDDVAIIGAGNEELFCNLTYPPISSVQIPWQQIGQESGRIAAQLLAGRKEPLRCVLFQPFGVAKRQSTDITLVADPDVRIALRYIRQNYHTIQSTLDLVRQVACNRRALERAFRKHLNRGILDEIRRTRVAQARQLLATTDLPLERIVELCGFGSMYRLDAAFKTELSATPAGYRRRFRVPGQTNSDVGMT